MAAVVDATPQLVRKAGDMNTFPTPKGEWFSTISREREQREARAGDVMNVIVCSVRVKRGRIT